MAVLLNHKEIGKHTERITKIKAFINKNKWEGIKFPSENDNWKKIEKNNVATALLVLLKQKKDKIYPAYLSRHNLNHEKQVIRLIISNRETRERWRV